MKLNKKVFSFCLLLGMLAAFATKAHAEYTSFTSTGICITTDTRYGLEMLSVSWSSGSQSWTDSFMVINDSVPITYTNLGSTVGVTLQAEQYTQGLYPPASNIIPPIVLFTTVTATTQGATPYGFFNRIDLRDANGHGIPVYNGIVVHILGTKYGTAVTIEWRRKSPLGYGTQGY